MLKALKIIEADKPGKIPGLKIKETIGKPHLSNIGKIVRAYISKCIRCRREEVIKDDGSNYMNKATAEWSLRNNWGWTRTKNGWKCPSCIRKST